jgi:hypothetical protein
MVAIIRQGEDSHMRGDSSVCAAGLREKGLYPEEIKWR